MSTRQETPESTQRADGCELGASPCSAFSLGQVLSASSGRLLCPIGGVYEILNHITGDNLYTHVLPRALKFASPLLKAHFPELEIAESEEQQTRLNASLEIATDKMAACQGWLQSLPLPQSLNVPSWQRKWEAKDPLAELAEEIGEDRMKARVTVVNVQNAKLSEPRSGDRTLEKAVLWKSEVGIKAPCRG